MKIAAVTAENPLNGELVPFGTGALVVISLYILSLIFVGYLGYRARSEDSLKDFYLAGKGFGLLVLVLTLYATQYSGNTLFGFTGKTYRVGYFWTTSIHFMTAIVVFYLLFAPRLHRLAKREGFITPTDYLSHRYGSDAINIIATIVMIVALGNYTLAQLMAMGRAFQGLTDWDPVKAYQYGVVILALIMVVYETLGGMRAIAWTDAIQGTFLLVGFAVLLVLVFDRFGSLEVATQKIISNQETVAKAAPPTAAQCRQWLSYILVVGLGGALYPQAIQRIYAAKSVGTLRKSFAIMAFLPLTTTLVALIVGILALANMPGLKGVEADKILMLICKQVQSASLLGYWLVVILFAAVLAAIMSTADSALLAISAMFTKDLYGRYLCREAGEKQLTKLGKIVSWLVVIILVGCALTLRENTTLISLLDRKFDMLIQLVPAFILGVNWRGLRRGPTLAGLVIGLAVSLGITATLSAMERKPWLYNMHPGIFGLLVNLVVAVGGSIVETRGKLRRGV